jgi:hypothetical protein
MVQRALLLSFLSLCLGFVASQSNAATNFGLLATATVPVKAVDSTGETLGGFCSGMWWDGTSRSLYCLPDRGPMDGKVDYRPRVQEFALSIDLTRASSALVTGNLILTNTSTRLLHDETGHVFSGFDANDTAAAAPRVAVTNVSSAPRAIDPEGIVRAPDGSFYISDEYGPFVYHFDADFRMVGVIQPPSHFLPKRGGKVHFSAVGNPDSGRTANHGFEGLGITPGGDQLWAALQKPLVQDCYRDGQKVKNAHFTRVLTWSLRDATPQLTGEYAYPLDLEVGGAKAASVGEILVLNDKQFLVLEHDARGLGSGKPEMKDKQLCRIYLASLSDATNLGEIEGTPYSREAGDPKGRALDGAELPSPLKAISKILLVDLMEPTVLAKAGIRDASQMPEKWEGMALVPDPSMPQGQYLLLVGVDNDFKTYQTFVRTTAQTDGVKLDVATPSGEEVPSLVFAFRVELLEYVPPVPQINKTQTKSNSNGG